MRCPHCGADNVGDARFCGACGRATAATEPTVHPRAAASGMPDMTGREIAGRYRVLTKLGEGGMGTVYRAEQMSLKRKVALKLLRPELSADPGLVRRFNAEAELVAKLSHPNTVGIYDFGQDADGTLFIAMEFIEGRSLREALTEGPLPPERALAIATQICAALGDAHSHGIVHRDLKPDNVMLAERGRQRDVVRVLDFGIAKLRDEGSNVTSMTRAGDLVGTPQYMAPEQIRGEAVDGRIDVYALGALLYEMITGRLPFEAPTVMAILSKHLTEEPLPPAQRRPDLPIPNALDQLVVEMLRKDPAYRPQSMERLGERLAEVAARMPATRPSGAMSQLPASTGSGTTLPPGARPLGPPPGVPRTYPPGVMVAPPEGRAPPVPIAAAAATPAPMPMQGYGSMGAPMAMPPTPPPGPAPYATPPPMGYGHAAPAGGGMHLAAGPVSAPAPQGAKTGLWIAIALVLVAAGGVAIYFATRGGGGGGGGGLVGPGPGPGPIAPGPGPGPGPITPGPGPGPSPTVAGTPFQHEHGWRLILPPGFTERARIPTTIIFGGEISPGENAAIAVGSDLADSSSLNEQQVDQALLALMQADLGKFQRATSRTLGGVKHRGIVYDIETEGVRCEMIAYLGVVVSARVVVCAAIAKFDSTAAFRDQVYQQRFEMNAAAPTLGFPPEVDDKGLDYGGGGGGGM